MTSSSSFPVAFKFQPLFDRVVVRNCDENGKTRGGLFIPEIARGASPVARGEVLAIGTGRVNAEGKVLPLAVKVGDAVWYDRKAGQVIPWGDDDGEEVILLRELEILGVLTGLARDTGLIKDDGSPVLVRPEEHH